jgi:hypothetical protein
MNSVISEGGERLTVFLDGTHVETRWIADYHVIWQTGQRNGPAEGDAAHHTHCSAYVAAAALYLDIYILRPPNHMQLQLANAQVDWLGGNGNESGPTAAEAGWSALGSSGDGGVLDAAVTATNLGKLVVAGYKEPPRSSPTAPPCTGPGTSSSSDRRSSSRLTKARKSSRPASRISNRPQCGSPSAITPSLGQTISSFLSTIRLSNRDEMLPWASELSEAISCHHLSNDLQQGGQ